MARSRRGVFHIFCIVRWPPLFVGDTFSGIYFWLLVAPRVQSTNYTIRPQKAAPVVPDSQFWLPDSRWSGENSGTQRCGDHVRDHGANYYCYSPLNASRCHWPSTEKFAKAAKVALALVAFLYFPWKMGYDDDDTPLSVCVLVWDPPLIQKDIENYAHSWLIINYPRPLG